VAGGRLMRLCATAGWLEALYCKRARSSFPRRCSCCDMGKLFERSGLELAEWARKRVEDEDDEDALCWSLPTASCRLPALVAAEGREGESGKVPGFLLTRHALGRKLVSLLRLPKE